MTLRLPPLLFFKFCSRCVIILPCDKALLKVVYLADRMMDGRPHSKLVSIQHLDQDDRDWLLQEENLVAIHLSSVQSKLNSFLPVYGLPEELVVHIFKIVAASASTSSRWIHVTHVCRHWRNIALSTPTLWTKILTSPGPDFATACLERSGTDMPLEIFWRNRHAHAPSYFPALFTEAARRRVIVQDVEMITPFLRSYALDCTKGYTNLQALSLQAANGRKGTLLTSLPFLNLNLLVAPEKLTYLQMRLAMPSPFRSIGLCTNLRTLRLVRTVQYRTLHLIDLLQVLDRCALLQHFLLVDAGARASLESALENLPYDGGRKVKMNHLQSLTLTLSSGRYTARLLASLVIPHDTRVHLQNNSDLDDNGPFTLLLPTDDLSDLHFVKTLRRLELSLRHGTELHAKAYHDDSSLGPDTSDSLSPRLHIISATSVRDPTTFDELSKVFSHTYLETLSVEANLLDHLRPPIQWRQLLLSFPKTKTLKVSFQTQPLFSFEFEDYLAALTWPSALIPSQLDAPTVALPVLETLHLTFFKKVVVRELRQELVAYACLCQARLSEGQSFHLVVNGKVWKIPKVCATVYISAIRVLNMTYCRNVESQSFRRHISIENCYPLIQPGAFHGTLVMILVQRWRAQATARHDAPTQHSERERKASDCA